MNSWKTISLLAVNVAFFYFTDGHDFWAKVNIFLWLFFIMGATIAPMLATSKDKLTAYAQKYSGEKTFTGSPFQIATLLLGILALSNFLSTLALGVWILFNA